MSVASHVMYRPVRKHFSLYCFGAALAAGLGSLALVSIAHVVATTLSGTEPLGSPHTTSLVDFLGIVVFAPLVETLLLVAVLSALSKLPIQPLAVAAMAAVLARFVAWLNCVVVPLPQLSDPQVADRLHSGVGRHGRSSA